jgi:hypothetical protein
LLFYDPIVHEWRIEPGDFEIFVGSSSRDFRLQGKITVLPD